MVCMGILDETRGSRLRVWILLRKNSNKWFSVEEVAEKLDMDRTTARKALRDIQQIGPRIERKPAGEVEEIESDDNRVKLYQMPQ